MPVNYTTAVKNARLQTTVDLIGATGKLVIGTAALAGGATGVLAEVPFDNPSFTVDAGAMEVNNPPRTVLAAATGVAAKVEIRSGDGTIIADGLTIGLPASGADVIINALEISAGQTVQVTIGTITHG